MKINRKELHEALKIAGKVAPARANLPILSNVVIDGEKQRIVATDLDVAVFVSVEIQDWETVREVEPVDEHLLDDLTAQNLMRLIEDYGIEAPKKAKTIPALKKAVMSACEAAREKESRTSEVYCINASNLQKIVGSLETDSVEIVPFTESGNGLFGSQKMVRVGDHFQGLPVSAVDEYPLVNELEKTGNLTEISKRNLGIVMTAATMEDSGFKLGVINFDAAVKKAVTTDGHRLHMVPIDMGEETQTWSLPLAAARMIKSFGKDDSNYYFEMDESGHYATLEIGKATFLIRLSDAIFPDWKKVVPKPEWMQYVNVVKSNAMKALNQAKLMTDNSHPGALLRFNGGIDLLVKNPERGSYERTNITTDGKIEPAIKVGMNLRYLIDAMSTAQKDDDVVKIGVWDLSHPVTVEQGDFFGLIMPMRMDWPEAGVEVDAGEEVQAEAA